MLIGAVIITAAVVLVLVACAHLLEVSRCEVRDGDDLWKVAVEINECRAEFGAWRVHRRGPMPLPYPPPPNVYEDSGPDGTPAVRLWRSLLST